MSILCYILIYLSEFSFGWHWHRPESFFEEDGEEADTDSRTDLNDDLDEVTPALEVLAHHQRRRFPHQRYGHAHQSPVTVGTQIDS